MANYHIEEIDGEFTVVQTKRFLFWKLEKFIDVNSYESRFAFMWFNHTCTKQWFSKGHNCFKSRESAERAMKICQRVLK